LFNQIKFVPAQRLVSYTNGTRSARKYALSRDQKEAGRVLRRRLFIAGQGKGSFLHFHNVI
jgi:hypothetical protein